MLSRIIIVIILFLQVTLSIQAQGRYAGTVTRKLIGKTYTDNRDIPGLEQWTFREGSIASLLTDPERFMVHVYQYRTTYIAFVSLLEDTALNTHRILDVVEIKDVKKTRQLRSAVCRSNEQEDAFIVALLRPLPREYIPVQKAWRFHRDKRRFEQVSAAGVDCINEGFGE